MTFRTFQRTFLVTGKSPRSASGGEDIPSDLHAVIAGLRARTRMSGEGLGYLDSEYFAEAVLRRLHERLDRQPRSWRLDRKAAGEAKIEAYRLLSIVGREHRPRIAASAATLGLGLLHDRRQQDRLQFVMLRLTALAASERPALLRQELGHYQSLQHSDQVRDLWDLEFGFRKLNYAIMTRRLGLALELCEQLRTSAFLLDMPRYVGVALTTRVSICLDQHKSTASLLDDLREARAFRLMDAGPRLMDEYYWQCELAVALASHSNTAAAQDRADLALEVAGRLAARGNYSRSALLAAREQVRHIRRI